MSHPQPQRASSPEGRCPFNCALNMSPKKSTIPADLLAEINHRKALGAQQVSLREWKRILHGLGYRFDRRMACRSRARYMMGSRAGATYPCLSLKPAEIATGMSWAHVDARRDVQWNALKATRESYFAVVGGHLAEW